MITRIIICCLLCSLNAAAQEPADSVSTQKSKPSLMDRLHQVQQYLDTKAKKKVDPAYIEVPDKPWRVILRYKENAVDVDYSQDIESPETNDNLTRNHSYELTIVTVGVAYGTEIHRVREVLVEAMKKVRTKDQYGREIVDPAYGINVVVGKMNDSAVDVNVKQYVLVAERIGYVDRAKEVIYDALTAAGITIPFPQCDVHLIHEE